MSLKIKTLGLLTLFLLFAFNCSKKVTKGYDYSVFSKQVNIFGVTILATEETDNIKVVHAANILAEYLDNDEDGTPDNPKGISSLIDHNAT